MGDAGGTARIAYEDEAERLSIWFRESGKYVYEGVPRGIYEALKTAPSAGRAFNSQVKGRFRCRFDPSRKRFRPMSEPFTRSINPPS